MTLERYSSNLALSNSNLAEMFKKRGHGSDIDDSAPADKTENGAGRADSQDSGNGPLVFDVSDQIVNV